MKKDYIRDAKILCFDLEVSPNLGWFYGQYDTTPIKIEQPPILLAMSWKWLGEKGKPQGCTIIDFKQLDSFDDSGIVRKLWALLDEAKIVVGHNCVEENTPILTADLRWVPAKELKVGDELGAFEEGRKYGTPLHKSGFKQRKYTKAVVESVEIESRDCIEIELDNGEKLICTPDHLWLGKSKKSEMLHWRMACELEVGDRIPKWFNVWQTGKSYEEGWLGGFIEGEGSIKQGRPKMGSFCGIEICQRPTTTWQKCLNILKELGYQYTMPKTKKGGLGRGDCQYIDTLGGRNITLEIIGRLGVKRFIDKLNWDELGQLRRQKNTIAEHPEPTVVAIREVGKRNIVKMQTSSRTFFAQGYGSHNCKRFDEKMANAFFLRHGMNPPSPYQSFDTLQTARKYFRFDNNKLDYLGKLLIGEGKTDVTYGDCWDKMLHGSLKEKRKYAHLMDVYCRRDVEVLENVYYKLLPWATNHPNVALAAGVDFICPRCGNDAKFRAKSYRRTGAQLNAIQYECLKCHGYVTRQLTKEEREEMDEYGVRKSIYRNLL